MSVTVAPRMVTGQWNTSLAMANERILITDDDPEIRDMLAEYLRAEGYGPVTAGCAKEALAHLANHPPDVVLLDVRLPDANGMELLKESFIPELGYHRVIMLSAYGTRQEVEDAIVAGAYDYLSKPLSLPRVKMAVRNCVHLQELEQKLDEASGGVPPVPVRKLVGTSPALLAVLEQIRQVAPFDVPVMLLGENGTGKELAARAIHALSPRGRGPFILMDCGALPETLVEAEIFGHERGAFSGAVQARPGRFERADKGTLFLDEIGNVPLAVQPKLLRVLESDEVERLGGAQSVRTDVRVISATNADVDRMVAEESFRRDLYHCLNTVTIRMPTLRERKEDIPLLVHYALMTASRTYKKDVRTVSPAAMSLLETYPWPGNVRELQNCVRAAVIMADRVVEPEHLPPPVRNPAAQPGRGPVLGLRLGETLAEIGRQAAETAQRAAILQTLEETRWNKTETAKRLRVDYKTLYVKMRLYGLQKRGPRLVEKPVR
ncbi:MAG: sigma-54 dependent transcriptional regulator [Nitrospirota bacterium]